MIAKLPTAKIIDLRAVLAKEPVVTTAGPILWATVEIKYSCATADPSVSIRVPIPWSAGETDLECRDKALRFARQLIDQACVAMQLTVTETNSGTTTVPVFQGLAQELGLAAPATNPNRSHSR